MRNAASVALHLVNVRSQATLPANVNTIKSDCTSRSEGAPASTLYSSHLSVLARPLSPHRPPNYIHPFTATKRGQRKLVRRPPPPADVHESAGRPAGLGGQSACAADWRGRMTQSAAAAAHGRRSAVQGRHHRRSAKAKAGRPRAARAGPFAAQEVRPPVTAVGRPRSAAAVDVTKAGRAAAHGRRRRARGELGGRRRPRPSPRTRCGGWSRQNGRRCRPGAVGDRSRSPRSCAGWRDAQGRPPRRAPDAVGGRSRDAPDAAAVDGVRWAATQ